jgi:23S rRNA pseudouridine955/2504/2580 synthase
LKPRLNTEKKKPQISAQKIKNFLATIIYQDKNLIAINKASGLATQGGSGVELSVDDLLVCLKNLPKKNDSSQKKSDENSAQVSPELDNIALGVDSPQLVHRLDKDTRGILLIARNKKSAEFLTKAFKEKTIEKTYLALVNGAVKKDSGIINIPLRKKFVGKNEKVYPDFEEGKEAITNFKVRKTFDDYSALELNPITGRTHQLRVHCKEIGHSIINDVKYGGIGVVRKELSNRLCLHAYKIKLNDYFGKELLIETEIPEFFKIKLSQKKLQIATSYKNKKSPLRKKNK